MRIRLSQSGPPCSRVIRAIVISIMLAFSPLPVFAGPFDDTFVALQGSWSGTGAIVMSGGNKERIRCDANHHIGSSSNELRLELTCASDSYKFDLQGQITASGDAISGNWFEKTRATGGAISGRIAGNQLQVRAEGQTFNALLSVTTRGERQTISIQSPGSEMSDVTITLTRKSR